MDSSKGISSLEDWCVENNSDLLLDWDYEKNTADGTVPSQISYGSKRKVWWLCHICHYEWVSAPNSRSRGVGCPYYAGKAVWPGHNDLASVNPLLASQWNYDKNGSLLPTQVSKSSSKRVWWVCSKCGHTWQSIVNDRTRNRGGNCPKCNNNTVA